MKIVYESIQEFLIFGLKQARASIFAGSFFLLLFLSNHLPLFGFNRYDFLFMAALLIQLILYLTNLETKDEVKVIFLFHIIGFVLELFKTNPLIGSWTYPEPGIFKIYTVPLYSGFMYAAVGSYISQAWKIFKLELVGYKSYLRSVILCILIYLNFFTHHFLPDFRWILIGAVFAFFWNVRVYFTIQSKRWLMPLNIAFMLIAFFIWIAENISTYFGAWKYPDQIHVWNVVSTSKITSWFLMVIISFIIVAYLKHFKQQCYNKSINDIYKST
jgi:uncharacterized membrane protein YoaT (DUF817 family)